MGHSSLFMVQSWDMCYRIIGIRSLMEYTHSLPGRLRNPQRQLAGLLAIGRVLNTSSISRTFRTTSTQIALACLASAKNLESKRMLNRQLTAETTMETGVVGRVSELGLTGFARSASRRFATRSISCFPASLTSRRPCHPYRPCHPCRRGRRPRRPPCRSRGRPRR